MKEKDCEEEFEKKIEKDLEKKFGSDCYGENQYKSKAGAMGGGFYFLTFIGAAVYYIGQASGFWMGVLGLLKALIWPAMLIYKVFTMLNM